MMDNPRRICHLQQIREYELQQILPLLPKSASILEIGAGSGWQARCLMESGYHIEAIDIAASQYVEHQAFPITVYDGRSIPFSDDTFDVVFSSNALEHIAHLSEFESEIKRVLKPTGIAVHIVPTTAWRFWTLITHHFYVLQRLLEYAARRIKPKPDFDNSLQSDAKKYPGYS